MFTDTPFLLLTSDLRHRELLVEAEQYRLGRQARAARRAARSVSAARPAPPRPAEPDGTPAEPDVGADRRMEHV